MPCAGSRPSEATRSFAERGEGELVREPLSGRHQTKPRLYRLSASRMAPCAPQRRCCAAAQPPVGYRRRCTVHRYRYRCRCRCYSRCLRGASSGSAASVEARRAVRVSSCHPKLPLSRTTTHYCQIGQTTLHSTGYAARSVHLLPHTPCARECIGKSTARALCALTTR